MLHEGHSRQLTICSYKKRIDLVKEHPTLDNASISRQLGKLWKGLPAEERSVWVNLAAYDRARYIAECQIQSTQPSLATAPSITTHLADATSDYDMSALSLLSPRPRLTSSHGTATAASVSAYGDPLSQFSPPIVGTMAPLASATSASKKRKRVSTGSHVQLAYYYFRRAKRDVMLADNPSMLSADINREIGQQWHALRAEAKLPWMQMALANAKSANTASSCPKFKDPLAPKAPRSAFQFLLESRRQEHPNLAYNDLTKESAQLWRLMPDDRRAPWMKLAREDRLRYECEMKKYKPPTYARDFKSAKRPVYLGGGKGETNPQSAFVHFFRDKRVSHANLSFVELTQRLSRQWKLMSLEEKRPWLQRALDERARRGSTTAHQAKRTKSTDATPPTPPPPCKKTSIPRRPKSAFVHFQLQTRQSMPDMPYKDFMQKIAAMWKTKSDADKMPWQALAKQDLNRYTRECAAASSSSVATSATSPDPLPGHTSCGGGNTPAVASSLRLRHGFACFVQAKKHDILAKTPHLTHNELLHEVGKLWRDMSPLERQRWRDLMQDKKSPMARSSSAPRSKSSPETSTLSTSSPLLTQPLVDDSQQHHLELMDGLWGEDVESVSQHMFYEEDLAQSHPLSLPLMEDMDSMHHHPHSSDML
ncbi:hypothetical protein, variant [Aphanomyces invadans]|uniref:HMG box domain-containing protein n=1 Tax=Aphanomyces invadans TaxID=157072 RepID=A0A024TW24_9STRA|nr:hypothetical protein, variant [Aphanomyces invadans]ETV98345.1 hypothetical protein, variant [Aphanomyces invadans]|eukprot:XP_008873220.1 hypothetical protein, variant [Aphanomyces invadans]